jgi:NAD(P)-dependent dehydrogenase (short-subunit alcohol dehydrogenase family)
MAHRALITGASRGIGRGIALALAEAGHEVALAARDRAALEGTVAAARAAGAPRAVALDIDVGDPQACRRLAVRATAALDGGPIDILVHCAGVARNGAIGSLSLADWEASMRVNVTAAFVLAGELGPPMAEAGWGRIVTVGSLYARHGVARTAAYTASKHALLGLTRVLAAEYARRGVTANMVVPGWVDTRMVREQAERAAVARGLEPDEVLRRFVRDQPVGRMVTVDEVGALVAFLCSDAAAAITGQAIHVDGGSYQA